MASSVKQTDILNGNIKKALIQMALPLMLFNLINVVYSLVDTFWVGRLSELQTGAVSLVSPINTCGTAFVSGLSAGGMALMAKALGAQDKNKANNIATILIEMAIFFGLLMGAICIIFGRPILNWLETPADIYNDSFWYLMGLAPDFVFIFILTIFQSIRQSAGDSKTGVYVNIACAILNMILDPLLIFGLNLGIFGAALATTLSKALLTPLALYILLTDKQLIYINFKQYKPSFNIIKEVFTVGLPASMGSFLMQFGFLLMNKDIVSYGTLVISAYGIGNRISNIVYIPTNALGQALTPFIGQNLGARNYKRMKQCFKEAMILGGILSAFLIVIGFIITKPAINILIKDISFELSYMACEYCYYSIATIFFMAWMNNLLAVYNGSGLTKISLFQNVLRLWGFRIPLIKFFKNCTTLGPTGIWWSMIISNILICLVGTTIYLFYFKKKYPDEEIMV